MDYYTTKQIYLGQSWHILVIFNLEISSIFFLWTWNKTHSVPHLPKSKRNESSEDDIDHIVENQPAFISFWIQIKYSSNGCCNEDNTKVHDDVDEAGGECDVAGWAA